MDTGVVEMEETDVVIVGAGVAGLFAAYELVKRGFKGTITIVEQGLTMEERLSSGNAMRDALCGVGGPGFFSDGKICLAERAGTRLTEIVDSSILKDYVAYVWRILKEFLPEDDLHPTFEEETLEPLKSRLLKAGLKMGLSYPVVHLGSDRARLLGQSFEEFLRSHNVRFLTGTKVQAITLRNDAIEISLEKEIDHNMLRCQFLIAAVGKSGHDWLSKQFREWGVYGHPNTPDIGIRLEFPNAVTEQLFKLVQNPRIVMNWKDTFIRTHCWCYGGHIDTYDYLGSSIVDGETFKRSLTDYTSVNLLYHFKGNQDPVMEVRRLLQDIYQLSQGHPLKQSLGALRGDKQIYQPLKGSTSSEFFHEGHLERFLPIGILDGFIEFIQRLNILWPGIGASSTLVYAPVIEWDTYRLPVDENMSTPIPNIYAVGDGAGLSQGIVSAATSALIATKHLSQTYSSTQHRKQVVGSIVN